MEIRWLTAAGLAAAAVAGILPGSAEPGESPRMVRGGAESQAATSETGAASVATGSGSGLAFCEASKDYLLFAQGSVTSLPGCRQVNRLSPHPYERYPNQALAALAYADAKAAEVLGMRLRERNPTAALSLIVRASALAGGDTAPFRRYSNAYPKPAAIDGRPVPETARTKFVLAAVAEILGDEHSGRAEWETLIRRHSKNASTEIALLYTRTHRIIAEMQRVRALVGAAPAAGG
jgi:hypothetical protein